MHSNCHSLYFGLFYLTSAECAYLGNDETIVASREIIGVDLAGLLGGRMASAKGGSVPSGAGYGEGCPLSSRLKGLGERRAGSGAEPRPKTDLAYFENHKTLIFVPI